MSRPEPKFSVGEAVMIRCKRQPSLNFDFARVVDVFNLNAGEVFHVGVFRYSVAMDAILYLVDAGGENIYLEDQLRPIPREKPNGIDALEWIKDRCGVEA